jgi:hypothetical protein
MNNDLELSDINLKFIRKVNEIEMKMGKGMAINEDNEIYISVDQKEPEIYMFDLNFKKLKSVASRGNCAGQFSDLSSMFYKNLYLYVCDRGNNRIQVFEKELEYVKSVTFDYEPNVIKVSNETACVQGFKTPIYF